MSCRTGHEYWTVGTVSEVWGVITTAQLVGLLFHNLNSTVLTLTCIYIAARDVVISLLLSRNQSLCVYMNLAWWNMFWDSFLLTPTLLLQIPLLLNTLPVIVCLSSLPTGPQPQLHPSPRDKNQQPLFLQRQDTQTPKIADSYQLNMISSLPLPLCILYIQF